MNQKILEFIGIFTGMRKTLVMFLLIFVGIVFRVKGYLSGDNFVDLLKGTTIAFFSANGLEHLTSTVKEYINSKGQKETQTDIVEDDSADEAKAAT